MTWGNRIRLFVGFIVVLVVVAGATLVFNQRQSQVTSTSATIAAQEYAVGTDYGGTVTKEFVREGDAVQIGEKLFEVQSLQLQQDIDKGLISGTAGTSAYDLGADGLITFKAVVGGTVADINVKTGGYVQAGSELGTIDKADSLYVSSSFTLTARDYERISTGAKVDLQLPNAQVLQGTVKKVNVITNDQNQAKTTVEVLSPALKTDTVDGLTAPGTPIDATLHLRDDGVLAGVGDGFQGFLRQIGL